MGLTQSVPSETEENTLRNGTRTSDEKSLLESSPKRITIVEKGTLSGDPHHDIVLKFQKLQMDNIIEERNHSERIIREKEKLLKEKEETIRQQADLIKTQNELLGQRNQRRIMTNVGPMKSHHDAAQKARTLGKPKPSTKYVTSLENIHSNGQDHRNGDDYETLYYDVEPYPPKRQEKPSQTFNATNTPMSNFPYNNNPFQRDSRGSTSTSPYQASVRSPTSNGLPTSSQQVRRSQSNDYRRNNSRSDDISDCNNKQSADKLLVDLEKQTTYEVEKLDNAQNGKRPLKQVTRTQCTFKCSGCRVTRKYKGAPVGATQKCRKCDDNVGNKYVQRTCKSDDESQNPNVWTKDSQFLSDVD